jgi:hypothetical protein
MNHPALVLALVVASSAAAAPHKGIFLNGVNIDGVTDQKFENCTVVIDSDGNILITAKGYEVQTVAPKPASTTPAVAPGPVTKRYFLVTEPSPPGLAQYDVDVFVNSVWIKRIGADEAQTVIEITRHLKKGKNVVHFTATKNLADGRRSASPQHALKIIIGEGNMGGNNVMIDNPVLEYKRDASEMQSFSDDFTVTGR